MKNLLIVFMIFYNFLVNAQDFYFKPTDQKPKAFRSGLVAGSSYTIIGKNSGIFSSTVAPFVDFPVHKKLNLIVGLMSSYSSIKLPDEGTLLNGNQNVFSNGLYASGNYLLNPKITISSSMVYKQHTLINSQKQTINFDEKDLRFGIQYKVNDNFRIYGEFGVSNHIDPYLYRNPFSDLQSPLSGF